MLVTVGEDINSKKLFFDRDFPFPFSVGVKTVLNIRLILVTHIEQTLVTLLTTYMGEG